MKFLKKYWLVVLLYFVAFFHYGENYWFYHWHLKWSLLLAVLILPIACLTGGRLHWSLVPPIVSTLGTGLWIFSFRDNPYSDYQLLDQIAIHKTVAYTVFSFLLLLTFFSLSRRKSGVSEQIRNFYVLFSLMNSTYVIYEAILGKAPYFRGTLIGNSSMTSSMIGMTYPLVLRASFGRGWVGIAMMVIPFYAVWSLESTMGVGVMLVSVLGMLFYAMKGLRKQFLWIATLLMVLTCTAGYFLFGHGDGAFFQDSGRLSRWQAFMTYWWENCNVWFGAGPGISEIFLSYIQIEKHEVANEFFLWFHSDWLQLLFEQGFFGLGAYLLAAFFTLRSAARINIYLPAALLSYFACALGNYPVHLPLHAFYGFALVAMSFEGGHAWTTIKVPQE